MAKKKIGIDPDYKVIGFTGRIGTLEKDVPTLIMAFRKIKRRFPKTKLLLAGEVITEDFPRYKDIIYTGRQDNIEKYFQAMDIFVMPSLIETNSLATMEAMSTGCAVIATPTGNIPEYIIHGTNGIMFPKGDSDDLKEKLKYLVTHDSIRKKLGTNARQTIIERLEWKKTEKEIIKALSNF